MGPSIIKNSNKKLKNIPLDLAKEIFSLTQHFALILDLVLAS